MTISYIHIVCYCYKKFYLQSNIKTANAKIIVLISEVDSSLARLCNEFLSLFPKKSIFDQKVCLLDFKNQRELIIIQHSLPSSITEKNLSAASAFVCNQTVVYAADKFFILLNS